MEQILSLDCLCCFLTHFELDQEIAQIWFLSNIISLV